MGTPSDGSPPTILVYEGAVGLGTGMVQVLWTTTTVWKFLVSVAKGVAAVVVMVWVVVEIPVAT